MLFGLDGVEIGLIIVFLCLFAGILSGFPVAFAIGGAGIISFGIIAALDSAGLLIHQAIDTGSTMYADLVAQGVRPDSISIFRYPDLPRYGEAVFPNGWEVALDRNISFVVNRMNERVLAGQSIETLLAVAMFVLMGITLERSRIANDLLTTMARVFGPLPGGLAVSVVVVGAFLAASTGIVGATVVTMGLLSLPTMLRAGYSPQLATGVIAASGTLGQIIPPSIVIVLLGTLAGDLYSAAQEERASLAGCTDALTYLGEPAVVSVGTLFQGGVAAGDLAGGALWALRLWLCAGEPLQGTGGRIGRCKWRTGNAGRSDDLVSGGAGNADRRDNCAGAGRGDRFAGCDRRYLFGFGETASLRTRVGDQCRSSMIELHGQAAWDRAVAQQEEIDAAGGVEQARELSEEERSEVRAAKLAASPAIGTGLRWAFCCLRWR